jgi:hypothetical protein
MPPKPRARPVLRPAASLALAREGTVTGLWLPDRAAPRLRETVNAEAEVEAEAEVDNAAVAAIRAALPALPAPRP